MCQFFEKRGYHVSVVQAGHHRAQLIDSLHYKRYKKNIPTAFHLLSRFTLTTT